jgi:cell division protein FtsA
VENKIGRENMFYKIMKEKLFCGLDIGSQSIKVGLIRAEEHDKPTLIGVHEVKTCGFKQASVSDLGELSECIHGAVNGMEKKSDVKIKDVQLGINGELIIQRMCAAVVPLMDRGTKIISPQDVKKVQSQAKLLGMSMDETVLHNFPQYYRIDDVNTAVNPVGLYGRKLEIHVLMVAVHNAVLKNLLKAVNQAGYDVDNVFFSSFVAGHSSLTDFQKRQGCALINIGSAVSDLLIYKDGQVRYLLTIPWGGDTVTRSVAQALNVPEGLAEDIKTSYASVIDSDKDREEEILIKKDTGYFPVKKDKILDAIEPVIQEFLELTFKVIKDSALHSQINDSIYVCGGGAMLRGLPERLEDRLKLPVKIAKTTIPSKKLHNVVKFSAPIGLALAGLEKSLGMPMQINGQLTGMGRFLGKMKELYQEYF